MDDPLNEVELHFGLKSGLEYGRNCRQDRNHKNLVVRGQTTLRCWLSSSNSSGFVSRNRLFPSAGRNQDWMMPMILNVYPEGESSSKPPPNNAHWGRLRHLFVETLSESCDFSQRIVMLDPSNGDAVVETLEQVEFPENLQEWVNRYLQLGPRDVYLWRWCLFAVDLMTLTTVDKVFHEKSRDTKFLIGMFNCLIDDVADRDHNHRFVRSLLTLTRGGTPTGETPEECQLAEFVTVVWKEIWSQSAELPRFREFEPLLAFDLSQLCTTVEHSDLTAQMPELVNRTEHDLYSSHGMMVTVAATVDLMASPGFDLQDLSGLRSLLWHAESMARIGNMVSTWEREIADGDFTSGVFMEAVWQGYVDPSDLQAENEERLVQSIIASDIEGDFLRRWETHRSQVRLLGQGLKSIDIEDYIGRLDRLLESELFSHGQK